MKRALITGITGQDGSYLAEFLLDKEYEVHGIIRRASVPTTSRIDHIIDKLIIHEGDLSDSLGISRIIFRIKPDEIYNLAAQSHVQTSFETAEYTGDVDALGVLRILEAVHTAGLEKTCRIYQASTSELYGKVEEVPQNENTPARQRTVGSPRSSRLPESWPQCSASRWRRKETRDAARDTPPRRCRNPGTSGGRSARDPTHV